MANVRALSDVEMDTVNSRVKYSMAMKKGEELRDPRDKPTVAGRINHIVFFASTWGSIVTFIGLMVAVAHGHSGAMQDWGIALGASAVVWGISSFCLSKLKERVKHITRKELVETVTKGPVSKKVEKHIEQSSLPRWQSWGMALIVAMRITAFVLAIIFCVQVYHMDWGQLGDYFANATHATCFALIFVLFFASSELREHIENLNPKEAEEVLNRMDQELSEIENDKTRASIEEARASITAMKGEVAKAIASPNTLDRDPLIDGTTIRDNIEGLKPNVAHAYLDGLESHLNEIGARENNGPAIADRITQSRAHIQAAREKVYSIAVKQGGGMTRQWSKAQRRGENVPADRKQFEQRKEALLRGEKPQTPFEEWMKATMGMVMGDKEVPDWDAYYIRAQWKQAFQTGQALPAWEFVEKHMKALSEGEWPETVWSFLTWVDYIVSGETTSPWEQWFEKYAQSVQAALNASPAT